MGKLSKLKLNDVVEVIFCPCGSIVKEGTKGTVIGFEKDGLIKISWNEGWVGHLPRQYLHRVGDPEPIDFVEMKIVPIDKGYEGTLIAIHRAHAKSMKVKGSCPYNVCKDLVSLFKHEPLKHLK